MKAKPRVLRKLPTEVHNQQPQEPQISLNLVEKRLQGHLWGGTVQSFSRLLLIPTSKRAFCDTLWILRCGNDFDVPPGNPPLNLKVCDEESSGKGWTRLPALLNNPLEASATQTPHTILEFPPSFMPLKQCAERSVSPTMINGGAFTSESGANPRFCRENEFKSHNVAAQILWSIQVNGKHE